MKDINNTAKHKSALNLYITAITLFLAGVMLIAGLYLDVINTFSPEAEIFFWVAVLLVYSAVILAVIASRILHKDD